MFRYTFFLQSKVINTKKMSKASLQNILKLWRIRNITLEGKIIIFKILTLSKIVHLTLVASFSKHLIEDIQKM